jgi:hypothetical protein
LKAIFFLGSLFLILSFLTLPVFPEHRQKMISSTKAFFINGKRYLIEKAAGGDMSLIHRELLRHGWDVHIPGNSRPGNPYFEDALREDDGAATSAPIAIPQGLHPEHVVQMVSDSGPVELVVGSMDARGSSARNRLPNRWKHIESDHVINPQWRYGKKGKETFLVFWKEKGKFLLMRKPE